MTDAPITGDAVAQELYALATALYALQAVTKDQGPLVEEELQELLEATSAARLRAAGYLRVLGRDVRSPEIWDDLRRLDAAILGGAISPDAIARAAGWVSVIDHTT